jgi:hypothetical protein
VPRLRKAFALSASDWLQIARAARWFVLVEFGLRYLALCTLLRITGKPTSSRVVLCEAGRLSPERVAYCVELVSRLDPFRPTCLKKALVLYALLSRKGLDVQLMIGAARDGGLLDAHAWLEHQGRIILGAPTPGRYSTLCMLDNSLAGTRPQEQAAS